VFLFVVCALQIHDADAAAAADDWLRKKKKNLLTTTMQYAL